MRLVGLSVRIRALRRGARSAVRSARFVEVTTRKARGRPKLFALTAFGTKTWSAKRGVFLSRRRTVRLYPKLEIAPFLAAGGVIDVHGFAFLVHTHQADL